MQGKNIGFESQQIQVLIAGKSQHFFLSCCLDDDVKAQIFLPISLLAAPRFSYLGFLFYFFFFPFFPFYFFFPYSQQRGWWIQNQPIQTEAKDPKRAGEKKRGLVSPCWLHSLASTVLFSLSLNITWNKWELQEKQIPCWAPAVFPGTTAGQRALLGFWHWGLPGWVCAVLYEAPCSPACPHCSPLLESINRNQGLWTQFLILIQSWDTSWGLWVWCAQWNPCMWWRRSACAGRVSGSLLLWRASGCSALLSILIFVTSYEDVNYADSPCGGRKDDFQHLACPSPVLQGNWQWLLWIMAPRKLSVSWETSALLWSTHFLCCIPRVGGAENFK